MNLKRGVLLSVAALMVGSVGVLACTRAHEDTAHDETAAVDEACRDHDEASGPRGDDAPATMSAAHRGDPNGEGPEGQDPGWFSEGPGEGSRAQGPGQGWGPQGPEGPYREWDGRGGPEGPRQGWDEARGRDGRGRGQPGEMRGRRGHHRGRRGAGGRGQRPQGGEQGGGRRFGGMEREIRPWLRALWEEVMALAQGTRGRDQGPPGV
jgi:hypothetical protein